MAVAFYLPKLPQKADIYFDAVNKLCTLDEMAGHCKNSEKHVMAQGNRKKERDMFTGEFHVEK